MVKKRTSPSVKVKFTALTDLNRLEIIRFAENGMKKVDLARKYSVSEGAIRKILKNKDKFLQRHEVTPNLSRRKFKTAQYPELENELFRFVSCLRVANVPCPPSIIQVQAKEIANKLNILDFKASNGWLENFLKRFNLKTINLFGEGGEVNKDDPTLLEQLNKLYEIISTYDPEFIYNMDETGLFYRVIPNFSVLLPSEKSDEVRGKKVPKDRVTIICCANATGTHKIPLTMIAKPKQPACIRGHDWPINYVNQGNAWQDTSTFVHWLTKVFRPELLKKTGRNVLLLIDNATSHPKTEIPGIRMEYFPPNCTSWKQAMDQGIIHSFKKRYKYLLLKRVIEFHELPTDVKQLRTSSVPNMRSGTAGLDYGKPAHLLDAAKLARQSWDNVTSETIKHCFDKAEIINQCKSESTTISESQKEVTDSKELKDFEDSLVRDMLNLKLIPLNHVDQFKHELNEMVHLDDENSQFYQQAIIEEVTLIIQKEDTSLEMVEDVVVKDSSDNDVNSTPDSEDISNLCNSIKTLELDLLRIAQKNCDDFFFEKHQLTN